MGAHRNPPKATIDFETRSSCDLADSGSWRYSLDPSTDAMCLAFRLPGWEAGRTGLWHMAFDSAGLPETPADDPDLLELFAWVTSGGLVEAHNSWFERGMWDNVMVPRYGWPAVGHAQWRCSAAKAAAYSLPRSLGMLAQALRLDSYAQKDAEGNRLMRKMSKPRRLLKRELKELEARGIDPSGRAFWHESREELERLFAYCRQDVIAEEATSGALRDLSEAETRVFLMDQAINERGFQLDRAAVESALVVIDEVFRDLNRELVELTGGTVQKATQRSKMLQWFWDQGFKEIGDTQGGTIDALLKRDDLQPHVHRALQLVRTLGRSSTAKYEAMVAWACPDWAVRGGLLYHGAGTGRWSGKGIQPHNFPRGNIKDMELVWEAIKTRDPALLGLLYGDVMEALAGALRGAIVARPGTELHVADYSAIEARVVFWLADDQQALDVFRRGDCIYCDMASAIYRKPINKRDHPNERQMGKQAVLGLGYQMGAPRFVDTVAKYGMKVELDFAQFVVDTYREKYWRIRQMWWDQEAAAIEAVRQWGRTVSCGKVQWRVIGDFLHCRLPSGRLLGYPYPVVAKKLKFGRQKDTLTFEGVDPYTRKWTRQDTYGGMLVENITQAVARDLMAHAMLECEEGGVYRVLLSVHDELICEADEGKGSAHGLELIMSDIPPWADGCPVTAEGWTGRRYRK